MNDKEELLSILKELRNDVGVGEVDRYCSICEYVMSEGFWGYSEIFKPILRKLGSEWEHFSGDVTYPVPDPDGVFNSQDIFEDIDVNMWEGEYGALRKDLLNFMISELEKEGYHDHTKTL